MKDVDKFLEQMDSTLKHVEELISQGWNNSHNPRLRDSFLSMSLKIVAEVRTNVSIVADEIFKDKVEIGKKEKTI